MKGKVRGTTVEVADCSKGRFALWGRLQDGGFTLFGECAEMLSVELHVTVKRNDCLRFSETVFLPVPGLFPTLTACASLDRP